MGTIPPVAPSQVKMQDIDYGSLANTLLPFLQSMGLDQATMAQNSDALHSQVTAAQQQAQQAGQAYQQAAAEPPPQNLGASNFYDQLMGNVASVVGQNPQYAQQAMERGQNYDKALASSRAQNLAALKTNYENQAANAEKLGNTEMAAQMRAKVESVSKALTTLAQTGMQGHQKVVEQANAQGGAMELQGLKGQQAMELERLKGNLRLALEAKKGMLGPDDERWLKNAIVTTGTGFKVLDTSGLTGNAKNGAIKWALEQDMPALGGDDMKVLQDIQGARSNVNQILDGIEQFLPTDPISRITGTAGIQLSKVFQTEDARSGFGSWRTAAIKNLRATAGSGGLRINQREIELAVANDIPKLTDTVDTARTKMQHILDMLENAEMPLASHDWQNAKAPNHLSATNRGAASATSSAPASGAATAAGGATKTSANDPLGIRR